MSEQILPHEVQRHPVGTRIVLTDKARIYGAQEAKGITGTVIPHKSRLYTGAALDKPLDGYSVVLLAQDEFTLLGDGK